MRILSRKTVLFTIFFFILFIFIEKGIANEHASILKDIKTQYSEGILEIIISAHFSEWKYDSFFLENPSKLVVDLSGVWENRGKSEYKIDSEMVKGIRIGEHSDKLRIVLDFRFC